MKKWQLIKATIVVEISCDRLAATEYSTEPTILYFYLLFIRIKRCIKARAVYAKTIVLLYRKGNKLLGSIL